MPLLTRRRFLRHSAALTLAASLPPGRPTASAATSPAASPDRNFSFLLLGDLHFDRPEHHDLAWVRRDKPNDVRQIEGYCRNTREVTPQLLATLRRTWDELHRQPAARPAFVLQVGDLVEGLCGSEELAARQNREAVEFVEGALPGRPFLFTKGNHDITGPGAGPAFGQVFHPYLTTQVRRLTPGAAEVTSARFTVDCGRAQFVFFDAYEAAKSLEWLEAVAARRTAEHWFVVIHPPVVPYGARSTWHVFASPKEQARREKLLALLGDQQAIVLGGHIHRYNRITRRAGRGRFTQFALSSVLTAPEVRPQTVLEGIDRYTPDQISVEPSFSPTNEAERRAVYVAERPAVTAFEYADLPGYAVVTVDGPQVLVRMCAGTGTTVWRTARLDAGAV
jgi:hypothetical protein